MVLQLAKIALVLVRQTQKCCSVNGHTSLPNSSEGNLNGKEDRHGEMQRNRWMQRHGEMERDRHR